MRELHVVAVSEDGRHVVLGPTKGGKAGTHRIRLDARLIAAVRGDLRPAGAPEVDLSPKEIQARLRAGESAEQIAQAAGVPVTRVARFAGPVAGELARTLDAARDGFVVRGRRGRSSAPLGVTVDAALAPVARPGSLAWGTRRADDGRWRVAVTWFARGREREAAWWYEQGRTDLVPVDPASAALGHVDAEPDRRPTKPAPAPRPTRAGVPRAATKAATKTPTKAAVKAPAKAAAKAAARRAPAKATSKAAATKPAVTKAAPKPAAPTATAKPVRKAAAKPAAKPAAARTARPRLQVVPDPPARSRTPKPADKQAHKDGVTTRASVPAWADVLLGTTPGGER